MDNYINNDDASQLIDGKNDWDHKKNKSLELSEVYKRLKMDNKAYSIKNCGTYLEFKRFKKDNKFKLFSSNFCKQRLCPMCSWRRSLKIFGQVSKIMDVLKKEKEYSFIFLTLTQRNVSGDQLNDELSLMFKAWKKLKERKQFKNAFVGWFRALEISHNLVINSRNFDTYHPHFHVILMVNKSYFKKSDLYITNNQMIELWKEAMDLDYSPNIDIRTFKSSKKGLASSIAEAAKYTVKDDDLLIPGNEDLTDKSVFILDHALARRRLIAFGGKLKEAHKKLNLDDLETGDLVNTDNEDSVNEELDYVLEKYSWNIGYKQYRKVD